MKPLFQNAVGMRAMYALFARSLIASNRIAVAELNCNAGIEFYPGGFKSCNLNGNHPIYSAQGLALTCADGYVLVQYPDGELKSCTIGIAHSFDSVRCDGPSRIELGPSGGLRKCE